MCVCVCVCSFLSPFILSHSLFLPSRQSNTHTHTHTHTKPTGTQRHHLQQSPPRRTPLPPPRNVPLHHDGSLGVCVCVYICVYVYVWQNCPPLSWPQLYTYLLTHTHTHTSARPHHRRFLLATNIHLLIHTHTQTHAHTHTGARPHHRRFPRGRDFYRGRRRQQPRENLQGTHRHHGRVGLDIDLNIHTHTHTRACIHIPPFSLTLSHSLSLSHTHTHPQHHRRDCRTHRHQNRPRTGQ